MPTNGQYLNGLEPKSEADLADVGDIVQDMLNDKPCNEEQLDAIDFVRVAIEAALKIIVRFVPACADRSTAIRKLREAMSDCNQAIKHSGRY